MLNKKLFKKILAILIISVMTMAIFASCTNEEDDTQTITTAQASDSESVQAHDEEKPEKILPNESDNDWFYETEHTLRILTQEPVTGIGGHGIWAARDIVAEEETGSPLNDAVYRRNAILEEKYNFTVTPVYYYDGVRTASRDVMAGDKNFDVIEIMITGAAILAHDGIFVNLFNINYLDFEKPWWDQGAVAAMSIGKKLMFACGDFTLINRDATTAILFNKKLIQSLQIENPYEFVRNNQWTIGKLHDMARSAAADLNGDTVMNWRDDRFGYLNDTFASAFDIYASGERFAVKNENDLPVLALGNERIYSMNDALRSLKSADFSTLAETYQMSSATELSNVELLFVDDRGLFLSSHIMSVEKLRGMETNFGILPMPKLDEYQREYGHSVDKYSGQVLAIPNLYVGDALDRIGFMLEAISAESMHTVIPAYYDLQLTCQLMRDEESREMLDIIFSSIVWDMCNIYDWFNFNDGQRGYSASFLESRLDMIEANMQKTIDAFAKLN
jgi:hypothetical protein